MEFVFNDYCNWKLENENLIYNLINNKSELISRFKHVYDVVEYYSDKMAEDGKLNDDELQIVESGFDYLYDQIQNISILLKQYFNDDLLEMEDYSELINLYLYSLDFLNEAQEDEKINPENIKLLEQYSDRIYDLICQRKAATPELHAELDSLCMGIFGETYYGVNEIFLDIANELGILDFE